MGKRLYCKCCKAVTTHYYCGPQLDDKGNVVFHLWTCDKCGTTREAKK